jgi:hypothetical protein
MSCMFHVKIHVKIVIGKHLDTDACLCSLVHCHRFCIVYYNLSFDGGRVSYRVPNYDKWILCPRCNGWCFVNIILISVVRSTARHAIHLQIDISTKALEIRSVQGLKCIVWCVVDCTWFGLVYVAVSKTKVKQTCVHVSLSRRLCKDLSEILSFLSFLFNRRYRM